MKRTGWSLERFKGRVVTSKMAKVGESCCSLFDTFYTSKTFDTFVLRSFKAFVHFKSLQVLGDQLNVLLAGYVLRLTRELMLPNRIMKRVMFERVE